MRETIRLSLRLSYSITPNMTLQYWGQPLVTKGNYMEFKYITDPLAKAYVDRFSLYDHNQITSAESLEEYSIVENQDGGTDYRSVNPNFNFIQFRSNMVFRWEYKPGSELFLVWSKNNSN